VSSPPRGTLYVDSSALVKLIVREDETDALQAELSPWPLLATSSIAVIEVRRAVRRAREDGRPDILPDAEIDALLDVPIEMVLTDQVRRAAAALDPDELRTLDAIHVASALALGDDLAALVTYDTRMQKAAESHRITILAPAA
jgi:predicted nucleic acid-binding protein